MKPEAKAEHSKKRGWVGREWEEEEGAGFKDLLLISLCLTLSLHLIEWQFSSSSLSCFFSCSEYRSTGGRGRGRIWWSPPHISMLNSFSASHYMAVFFLFSLLLSLLFRVWEYGRKRKGQDLMIFSSYLYD